MYPYIQFFGMKISSWTLMVTIGLLVALFVCNALTIKRGFSVRLQKLWIVDFLLTIVCGVFGAMLFQAVYDYFETGKWDLFGSGLTFYGGFIVGVAVFLLVWFLGGKQIGIGEETKRKFADMADVAACVIPLGHAFGRIGCLLAGCCYGAETDAWYGMFMQTEEGYRKVVPVQLYEAIFLFCLAGILLWLFLKGGGEKRTGMPLLPLYTIGYGVWRFLIEFARTDDRGQLPILTFLSPSQLTAILLIAIGGVYIGLWYRQKRKKSVAEGSEESSAANIENVDVRK